MKSTFWALSSIGRRVGLGVLMSLAAIAVAMPLTPNLRSFVPKDAIGLVAGDSELTFKLRRAYPSLGLESASLLGKLGPGWKVCFTEHNKGWVSFLDQASGQKRAVFQHIAYYRIHDQLLLVGHMTSGPAEMLRNSTRKDAGMSEQDIVIKRVAISRAEVQQSIRELNLNCE